MKLAEALANRSAAVKRFEQLRVRAQSNSRYQEGEPPGEDAGELLSQADQVLDELQDLIRRINKTNGLAELEPGVTLTDAIAARDVLRWRHSLYSTVADAAAGKQAGTAVRQIRSELRFLTALPVSDLRTRADELAKAYRELDIRLQRANWEADLAD